MDVASGSVSDGVAVEGEFSGSPTATFTTPVEATELERTVAIEGDGDDTAPATHQRRRDRILGHIGRAGLLAARDDHGRRRHGLRGVPRRHRLRAHRLAHRHRRAAETLYGETGNESIGVAPGETMVIVMDVVEVQEPLKPSEWTENVPEVEFGAEGESPTVTIPDIEPSTELQVHVIEEGDGDTVAAGDSVTLQYQGISWDTGEVFD